MSELSEADLNYAQEIAERAVKDGFTEAATVIRWLADGVWRLQRPEIGDPNKHLRDLEKLVRELTPNAERYVWWRDHWWLNQNGETTTEMAYARDAAEMDAAIDAARAKEPK